MTFDTNEVDRLIQNRRSVFPASYSGERVSDDIINQMLENANWAPTHKFTEPWRFQVFCDEGISEFIKLHKKAYKKAGKDIDQGKLEKLENKLTRCSHIISIGLRRHKSIPEMEEVAAVAAAVQNMHLTASAHGVGAYWSTGGVTYFKEARKLFNLKKDDLLMGFFFVGMPKQDKWPKSKRKSIDKKVDWVRK